MYIVQIYGGDCSCLLPNFLIILPAAKRANPDNHCICKSTTIFLTSKYNQSFFADYSCFLTNRTVKTVRNVSFKKQILFAFLFACLVFFMEILYVCQSNNEIRQL